MGFPMSNNEILEELDRLIYGHTEAKKALITMISRSKLRHHQKYIKSMEDEFLLSPMKVLLIGASGTGKTFLIECLQNVIHFPFIRLDATNLTPSGAGGGDKSEDVQKKILKNAMKCCVEYPYHYPSVEGAIDRTVVFVDEIDKLGTSFESSGNWNKHVQSNFLTLFDNKAEFSGVSFVFAGAFGTITAEKKSNRLGFTQHHTLGSQQDKKELIDVRVLKSGLIPEIVGRISAICELDIFTSDDLYYILKERVLPKKQLDLAAYHIFDIDINEDVLRQIAEDAAESGQGIRYLQRAIDKEMLEHEFGADVDGLIYNEWSNG